MRIRQDILRRFWHLHVRYRPVTRRQVGGRRAAGGALVLALLLGGPLAAETALAQANPQEARARLDSLATDIQSLQGKLEGTQAARGNAQQDLKTVETAIGKTHQRLTQLQAERHRLDGEVAALQQRRETLGAERDRQRQALATQFDALYRLGKTPQLKLLLNQDDPAEVDRLQHYLNALSSAREQRLDQLHTLNRELDDNLAAIDQHRERLDDVQQELKEQQQRLASRRDERRALVAKLDSRYDSEQSRLEDLNQDRAHVERLLDRMQQELANLKKPPPSTDIQKTRGDLPWPVQGTMLSSYGSGDGVNRNGILIGAPAGTAVKAVHAGRVVFANWMRGFGNLLILDHGDGVLTLYAHLQEIEVNPGAKVSNAQVVATVGDTGGQSRPALYFEVRQNGDPINPGNWIARR